MPTKALQTPPARPWWAQVLVAFFVLPRFFFLGPRVLCVFRAPAGRNDPPPNWRARLQHGKTRRATIGRMGTSLRVHPESQRILWTLLSFLRPDSGKSICLHFIRTESPGRSFFIKTYHLPDVTSRCPLRPLQVTLNVIYGSVALVAALFLVSDRPEASRRLNPAIAHATLPARSPSQVSGRPLKPNN